MELQNILEKWATLIEACKSYYVDSKPTGFTDIEYDALEQRALEEDGFSVRDYIFQTYLKGTKGKNSYIEKIKKEKVLGKTMKDALSDFEKNLGKKIYIDLKYDGTSIAIYIDPSTGIPKRILTCGNLNLSTEGIDQTYKLIHFLPERFPKGIVAIQAEALVDTNNVDDPEKARQKANGLINSKYCDEEVNNLLTLRAYRYYVDDSPNGIAIKNMAYPDVLKSLGTTRSITNNRILFSPADVFTVNDLGDWCEKDIINTTTGSFLADGMVIYDSEGNCIKAMKFSGAGNNSEGKIRTKVLKILWNNQVSKGKDSWSANVLIEPITLRGTVIRKPSAGSVSKLVKSNVTPGAEISIILANSTIPMISDVYSGGNGEFDFPKCSCGYQMSQKDIYGSNLKCGNPMCSERLGRMKNYLNSLSDIKNLDLNMLLVIDRFKWQETTVSIDVLIDLVKNEKPEEYFKYLVSFMKTDLQIRNLNLVWQSSYISLKNAINKE